jgi:hypothetical protein
MARNFPSGAAENVRFKRVPEVAFVSSSSSPTPTPSPAPAPAPGGVPRKKTKKGSERRRATRVPLDAQAELMSVPSSSRTAPIKVKIKDVSATGVGVVHSEPLPLGQKYVVKESTTIAKRKSVLYTVVRADPIGDNSYSIGLHDSHLMGIDYKIEKKSGRVAKMARLLIVAIIMGSLVAVGWTFIDRGVIELPASLSTHESPAPGSPAPAAAAAAE